MPRGASSLMSSRHRINHNREPLSLKFIHCPDPSPDRKGFRERGNLRISKSYDENLSQFQCVLLACFYICQVAPVASRLF